MQLAPAAGSGPAIAFIEARLREPLPRAVSLTRHALLHGLHAASAARLILIRAPAGYGKTSLLAQWRQALQARGAPHGWLSLERDESCDDVLAYLVRALSTAGCVFDAATRDAALLRAEHAPREAARRLFGGMRLPATRAWLLLDGVDELHEGAGLALCEILLRYAPSLQLVATARRRPRLALGKLRAEGGLYEVTARDLAFNSAEVETLFDAELPPRYADALRAHTDGVAVALSLARAALTTSAQANNWRDSLDEYYREQIIDQLPDDLRPTLSRLSIVDRFDTSLARAILGAEIEPRLERLFRDEGLLTIEAHSGLLQLPSMLRESLRQQLHWLSADERRELHQRAAAWYIADGDAYEALVHAIAAHDSALATRLFRQVGASTLVLRSGLLALRAALEQLENVDSDDTELLAWSRVLLLTQQGFTQEAARIAARIGTDSSRAVRDTDDDNSAATLVAREGLIIETLLAAYADQRLPAGREQELRRAAEQVAQHEHLYQGFISNLLCWMRYERAEFTAADGDVEHAIAEFAADDGLYGSLFMHLHRTIIRFWQNRLDEALLEARLVSRLQRLFFPGDGRLCWLCRVFEGFVLFELGHTTAAAALLHDILDGLDAREGWFEAQLLAHVITARIAAAQGRLDVALAALSDGQRIAVERALPRLGWHLDYQRICLRWTEVRDDAIPPALLFYDSDAAAPLFITWRERLLSAVLCARLALRARLLNRAQSILDRLALELDTLTVPRAATMLAVLRAQLAQARDQHADAAVLLDRARKSFVGTCSPQVFIEVGSPVPDHLASTASDETLPVTAHDVVMMASLTLREREILELLASGRPNKRIAHDTGLSEGTVKFHLRNIYRKLHARNRVEAVGRGGRYAEE